ncbi:hypothetical protein HJG60_012041 [Phyllostomus discolor]|uniref:40S ribosomal protein SA n=1 Tax=Phyllostomus discolor TaxID=89673 RepID=A0A833ZJL9_9CHIR|nr:hypothetical protein HJG60_012041 [Phyllostomus discolor]
MSGDLGVLQMKEEDVLKFLTAGTHLGGTNLDFQMEQHTYKRKIDGIYIINLKRTWEKLLMAAYAIVAIETPTDVSVSLSRNTGQDPKEIEMEEQATAGKAGNKEEFQGEWTVPAPEVNAAQPEVTDWSEGVPGAELGQVGGATQGEVLYLPTPSSGAEDRVSPRMGCRLFFIVPVLSAAAYVVL